MNQAVGKQIEDALNQMRRGQFAEAEKSLTDILSRDAKNFDALRLRGITCHLQGKNGEAVGFLERAVALKPDSAETLYNLGIVQHALKDYENAVTSFRKSLAINDQDAGTHGAMGSSLTMLKRYDKAIISLRRAIEIDPKFAEAHTNLGFALNAIRRFADAETCLKAALSLDPRSIEAKVNLGGVLNQLQKYEEAANVLRQAIALDGNLAEAHSNLGLSLSRLKQFTEAMTHFEHAVELDPNHHTAFSHSALIARRICDWSKHDITKKELARRLREKNSAIPPFILFSFIDDPAEHFQSVRQYASQKGFAEVTPLQSKASKKEEKIRIAYVSADFRDHPVAYQIAQMIEMHDRDRFEIIGISLLEDSGSDIGSRLRSAFDQFHEVQTQGDAAVANLIASKGVHIAVDLNGYTSDARPQIFSRRSAPIQVNYLGYPGTMGADYMDYIVVDPHIAPIEQQDYFSEKLVLLPDTYMAADNTSPRAKPALSRKDAGLPDDGIVFCCFHNSYKITPDIFDIWMRLLEQNAGSVLWLRLDDRVAISNLCMEAEKRGIAADRLIIAERMDRSAHLERQGLADLYLDTLPYNAHSSACDALWAGLPVLTCMGEAFPSRVAGSLLDAVGLPELITHSLEDYEALALNLAKTPKKLAKLRKKLDANIETHALFDCARFTRHLEAAYESMVETWRAGKAPAPISVDQLP